jgi:predicted nucleic acid-binding protein
LIFDTNALSPFADDVPPVVQQIANADELHVPAIVLREYRFGIAGLTRLSWF